ncbi:hypothetical protein PCO31111_03829 [Pandoraea communis]|uniref:Uncharacterized protein n=1 Tax=Pandoraea communis TaxID=2508297 RepID=A0A5E4XE88_9BURK|nr:hypothetical protein PCO31111_03829 [Pandoraea communis]
MRFYPSFRGNRDGIDTNVEAAIATQLITG